MVCPAGDGLANGSFPNSPRRSGTPTLPGEGARSLGGCGCVGVVLGLVMGFGTLPTGFAIPVVC